MKKVSKPALIILLALCSMSSGCALFKKKCDCPPVLGNSTKHNKEVKAENHPFASFNQFSLLRNKK